MNLNKDPSACFIEVENNQHLNVCYPDNNNNSNNSMTPVSAHQLRWSVNDENGDLQQILNKYSHSYHNNNNTTNTNNTNTSNCSNHISSAMSAITDNNITNTNTNTNTNNNITTNTSHHTAGCFDVIFACDVLFFVDFHDSLLYVLRHALKPNLTCCNQNDNTMRTNTATASINISDTASINKTTDDFLNTNTNNTTRSTTDTDTNTSHESVIFLLQPRRGSSMQLFIDKAKDWFDVTIEQDYDDQVGCMYV